MIEVTDLVKSYGDLRAVDGIRFSVQAGEIYGLLGPNGAGKTTTLSILSGLLAPDSGRVRVDGIDLAERPQEVKARLGVAPQENALYDELSAREHLKFWAGLYGLGGGALKDAVGRVLDDVGLTSRADEPTRQFSGGMKRRLNLALALVHSPKVVLLDEPTVGIDPQARNNILEVVQGIAEQGTTVLYTTHYLEEAERLCDRIAIVDHGKLLAEGTLDELQQQVGGEEVVTIRAALDDTLRGRLTSLPGVRQLGKDETDRLVLATAAQQGERGSVLLLKALFGAGVDLEGVAIEPPSLNGLFLKLTGRELRD